MKQEDIAIIGMGFRFPGGLSNAADFWKFLLDGRDAVSEVPPDRWNIERFYDAQAGLPGKSVAKRGGFISGLDQFDPQFFGISPREAPYIDPQQRLLLETAWEALEDAGLVLDFRQGTDIGVFSGISHTDYQQIQGGAADRARISQHSPTGHAHSIAANRVSYCLNLIGPSIAMDTACSSALTAVHVAVDHLRAGRCAVALAGGVTVMITPDGFIGFSQAGMLSPDGKCRAFDAAANGFVRGEGAGMVVLKPVSRALADGDDIYAVIRATAVNQDGHTNGIMLPGEEAQARLVREACAAAGVDPSAIGYVEAHGTGTAVGDPIEAHALSAALCAGRSPEAPLLIGSVKTNLGHLETAAGLAGLVKAALVVQHGQVPPSLHFEKPSPHIDFTECKLRVPTRVEPYPQRNGGPRLAAVNSFGFGGANAHAIVAEPPPRRSANKSSVPTDRAWPIVLSARSEESLRAAAARLAAWLEEHAPSNGTAAQLPDLVYTLGARRNHHAYRLTATATEVLPLAGELKAFAETGSSTGLKSSFTPMPERPLRVGFVMSGQGPQWWGMGRELMRTEPVFRRALEECAAAIDAHAGFRLLEELAKSEKDTRLGETEVGQPAIFAMQVALAALWKSWGVEPALITGHSVGEIAAAHVAGILTLEQAAEIITFRAQVMQGCARGEGAMLAVALSEAEVEELIAKHDAGLSIAAFNGPRSLTIAGLRSSLEKVAAELEAREIFNRFVRVAHPFHHAMMQPAADALEAKLADLQPAPGTVPFFSTVTGAECPGEECTARYWAGGIRQPVLFVPAVRAMAAQGVDVWLEISAHPALAISIQESLPEGSAKATIVSSARREREQDSAMEAVTDLHRAGVEVDFAAISPSRHLLKLPAYAWNKARWWSESTEARHGRLDPGGRGLLDARLPRSLPTWSARLDERHLVYLRDHQVEKHTVFPAAGFIEMALEAGREIFEGRPFVLEELEIRKPLILPENPEDVVLELVYDTEDRGFTIQSRFEPSATWSLHVCGSMRGERVESAFEATRWSGPEKGLEPMDVGEHYQHKHDLGLRYGPEFRATRELFAGHGKSCGVVALSDAAAVRVGEYALHPVIMDAALHVFSAAGRTVEGRGKKMKLPVRFARILYLDAPREEARVRAEVRHCNDELIEGRIGIYGADGRPCVLIDGFRAVSLSWTKRGGAGGRDLVYHVDWERLPADGARGSADMLPLAEVREAGARALEELQTLRGTGRLAGVMVAEDDVAAGQVASGLRAMGVTAGTSFTDGTLRVAPAMRRIFGRLMESLGRRGVLTRTGDGWKATDAFETTADDAPRKLENFLRTEPGHLVQGLLAATTGAQFAPIMRGEKDAVQVLFSGAGTDLLEQFYGDGIFSSLWLAAIAAGVRRAAAVLPEGRGLRVLEVGAGTGGLASYILPVLEPGLHSYVFTDASSAFFAAAQQKLAAWPEVEYAVLNLDQDPAAQDFAPGTFDFIVGTNVLHATADVRASLRHLHDLLAPGGTLFFMDVATPRLWTESIFGLTAGWWSITDHDLRPEHPLLARDRWAELLREVGFAEADTLPGLPAPGGGEAQIGLLARKKSARSESATEELAPASLAGQRWVIFADGAGLGAGLAARLHSAGAECRVVTRGDEFHAVDMQTTLVRPESAEDWERLAEAWLSDGLPQRFVWLWALDAVAVSDAPRVTGPLLHFSHVLDRLGAGAGGSRVDVVTRGAQPAGKFPVPVDIASGAVLGLFRVLGAEYPHVDFHAIDLPADDSGRDAILLTCELLRSDAEKEVALRGEARYGRRLARGLPSGEKDLDEDVPLRLESHERGVIDSLRLTAFPMPECGPDEVLIRVKAAGLNFRDILKALGLYPAETTDARMYGDEVAGEVVAKGCTVRHVEVGDEVFGLAVFGLATHTLARGADVCRLPAGLSCEEAATVPVVFMTAWHALKNVARLRRGETVLVHAGAGGVGMAAIQMARHFGAKVIASAGSPSKRALLTTLGVEHVIDSRRGDFAEQVMELTGGRGVDVVLNALAAEAISMGLSCLAEFGRFLEIGKRDIYQNAKLPMWHLRRNASFHVVAMDAVFAGDAGLTSELLAEITELFAQGVLRPLPYRSYPASRVDAAFRLMAAGKHTGKVILHLAGSLVPRRGALPPPAFTVDPQAWYLVTGGFGGFGKVVARWLVDRGARRLVLVSRQGAASPGATDFLEEMAAVGVEILPVAADAGLAADVGQLVERIRATGHPLKGVFHLAMVIDDAPLADLTPERFRAVFQPKAVGAWLLHEATRGMDLDAFVMFSSASSIFGNPAQGNYAAANALLDSLAHHRRALGWPALAVNWGALGGEGYVARNEKVAEYLARTGTGLLAPEEVFQILETLLESHAAQAAGMRIDWAKYSKVSKMVQENPFCERVMASAAESEEGGSKAADWRQRIEASEPGEREAVIIQALQDVVGSVLRVKPESLRPDQPLTDLGLDSLMGVEIENLIEGSIGVTLPPASLMRARTIGQIATLLNEHLGAAKSGARPETISAPVPAEEVTAEEIDFAELADEDLDRLLEGEGGSGERLGAGAAAH